MRYDKNHDEIPARGRKRDRRTRHRQTDEANFRRGRDIDGEMFTLDGVDFDEEEKKS